MKNNTVGVSDPHEGEQLSPFSSTTITLYLNSAINKRKIGRITKLVINKSRNCQAHVQGLSKTHPVRWRLLLAHSWCGECQQARKISGLALFVLTQKSLVLSPVPSRKEERDAYSV